MRARAQAVPVGDRARAAAGERARHRHEPARAAPPRALARRRAPAGRQPAAARASPPQGTALGNPRDWTTDSNFFLIQFARSAFKDQAGNDNTV